VVRRPKFDVVVDTARIATLLRVADAVADRVEGVGAGIGSPA
jgi:hypothetical protein